VFKNTQAHPQDKIPPRARYKSYFQSNNIYSDIDVELHAVKNSQQAITALTPLQALWQYQLCVLGYQKPLIIDRINPLLN